MIRPAKPTAAEIAESLDRVGMVASADMVREQQATIACMERQIEQCIAEKVSLQCSNVMFDLQLALTTVLKLLSPGDLPEWAIKNAIKAIQAARDEAKT